MISEERLKELCYIPNTIIYCVKENKIVKIALGYDEIETTLEDLFETEEDARWELEMTATRTETLKMPRFESIIEPNKTFVLYEDDKFLGLITVDQQIVINYYKIGEIKRIFDKPLTKENYIEACKLCLRLFKGEEV